VLLKDIASKNIGEDHKLPTFKLLNYPSLKCLLWIQSEQQKPLHPLNKSRLFQDTFRLVNPQTTRTDSEFNSQILSACDR
jgi:hypothetical protein